MSARNDNCALDILCGVICRRRDYISIQNSCFRDFDWWVYRVYLVLLLSSPYLVFNIPCEPRTQHILYLCTVQAANRLMILIICKPCRGMIVNIFPGFPNERSLIFSYSFFSPISVLLSRCICNEQSTARPEPSGDDPH